MANQDRYNQRRNPDKKPKQVQPIPDHGQKHVSRVSTPTTEQASYTEKKSYMKWYSKWKSLEVANKIAIIAVLVNVCLTFGTYRLYCISVDSYKLANTGDSTAIASLNTNQAQFAILNQPYLEIIDVSFNGSHNGKINIGYRIRNLSSVVVNEFKQSDTVIYRDEKNQFHVGNNYLDSIPGLSIRNELGIYNSTLKEIGIPLFSNSTYSDGFYNSFLNNKGHYYLLGSIYYKSDISVKSRVYEYVFEMVYQKNTKGKVGYTSIYSINRYE